mgnify:CR=1 FL=1
MSFSKARHVYYLVSILSWRYEVWTCAITMQGDLTCASPYTCASMMKPYGTCNCRIRPAVYWIHSHTAYRNNLGEITERLRNKSGVPKNVPGTGGNPEAPHNVEEPKLKLLRTRTWERVWQQVWGTQDCGRAHERSPSTWEYWGNQNQVWRNRACERTLYWNHALSPKAKVFSGSDAKFVPIRDKAYTAGCKQVYGQKPLARGKFTQELKALREGILMNA